MDFSIRLFETNNKNEQTTSSFRRFARRKESVLLQNAGEESFDDNLFDL